MKADKAWRSCKCSCRRLYARHFGCQYGFLEKKRKIYWKSVLSKKVKLPPKDSWTFCLIRVMKKHMDVIFSSSLWINCLYLDKTSALRGKMYRCSKNVVHTVPIPQLAILITFSTQDSYVCKVMWCIKVWLLFPPTSRYCKTVCLNTKNNYLLGSVPFECWQLYIEWSLSLAYPKLRMTVTLSQMSRTLLC